MLRAEERGLAVKWTDVRATFGDMGSVYSSHWAWNGTALASSPNLIFLKHCLFDLRRITSTSEPRLHYLYIYKMG
jgi:hypothetical protein